MLGKEAPWKSCLPGRACKGDLLCPAPNERLAGGVPILSCCYRGMLEGMELQARSLTNCWQSLTANIIII